MKKVENISQYLEEIQKHTLQSHQKKFFRGLSNREFANHDVPQIFRVNYKNLHILEYESEIFYELIRNTPEAFERCKSTFERLVLMQHYGVPTRLLDITEHPMVALYFACSSSEDKDGFVKFYVFNKDKILNYNDDHVALLSNLAIVDKSFCAFEINLIRHAYSIKIAASNTKKKFNTELIYLPSPENKQDLLLLIKYTLFRFRFIEPLCQNLMDEYQKLESQSQHIKDRVENINKSLVIYKSLEKSDSINSTFPKQFNQILDSLIDNADFIVSYTKSDKKIQKYYNSVYSEKNYINLDKSYMDLTGTFCIVPKLNNPRIINQRGAFILFGCSKEYGIKTATNTNPDHPLGIVINADSKKSILNELSLLQIKESTLFPELDKIFSEITGQFASDIQYV